MSINNEEQSNNIHETENNVVSRRTNNLRSKRCTKGKNVIDKGERQSTAIYKTLNQKDCIEWTVDLRAKFKEATQQLGERRCLPKKILEIMNVPGLTRMQLASYLGSQQRIESSSHRIFKRIPDLQTNVPNQTHGDPVFPLVNTNNIYASSIEQQLYHPQLQVQQHYVSSFLSGQNNDGGRLK
ncbi:hypothetical protein R3W88_000995 [Solanum pinnatisectum]|uniref:Uncharacterized protein n=1 Tax=Solanum pinnatisectum TaxID=50273 RepID=A0AAV9MHH7_9SOLN|nr:hypothetical protein R3W88_000995 [Solanum pinnatisectum]